MPFSGTLLDVSHKFKVGISALIDCGLRIVNQSKDVETGDQTVVEDSGGGQLDTSEKAVEESDSVEQQTPNATEEANDDTKADEDNTEASASEAVVKTVNTLMLLLSFRPGGDASSHRVFHKRGQGRLKTLSRLRR